MGNKMRHTISETRSEESLHFREYLEDLRRQGMKGVPSVVFYAYLASVAVCVMMMIFLIYSYGMRLIEAYFSDNWLLPLLLLSALNAWAAQYVVKLCVMLWKIGGEEDFTND